MTTDQLKQSIKATHDAEQVPALLDKIKQLESKLWTAKHELGLANEAVEYCLVQKITFESVSDAIKKYEESDDSEPADFYNCKLNVTTL